MYKTKLRKNNDAEIGKKYKLKTFSGWKVQKRKIKIPMIYISIKNFLTKE